MQPKLNRIRRRKRLSGYQAIMTFGFSVGAKAHIRLVRSALHEYYANPLNYRNL